MNMKTIKTLINTAFLVGFLSIATAQPLADLATQSIADDLNTYLKSKNDGWFAYSIKAAPETHSMCCFNNGEGSACDLNDKQNGYGSSSDSPYTDNIHVFAQIKQGQVKRIMPLGDHCEVEADGITVDWLSEVSAQQSIQWLKQEAKVHDDQNGSLYVLSLHPHQKAAMALFDLAHDNHHEYSQLAVFWLGQRKHDGFAYLQDLYQELPRGEVRRHINFALSQHQSKPAVSLLKNIAENDQDTEQQADAIFRLSQTESIEDLPSFLRNLMDTTQSEEVKEKAIFSLSQINSDSANLELAQLAKDHQEAAVREKSLFWLAQNSPEAAQQAATELLKTATNESEQENAVFVLSQLPSKQSADALFNIIQGNYPKNIKKKAIFWLSQSDDKNTMDRLAELL
jgi:HEAT repeat protein